MSNGIESKESVKRRNARPDRRQYISAKGNLYIRNHPGYPRSHAGGMYAQMLDEVRNPLRISSDNIAVTSDWHIPFCDDDLVKRLLNTNTEHGTRDLIIAGDFWDCDDYSRFTHLSPPACFEEEIENVRHYLKRILRIFTNVYICRGNHEKRWIDLNAGKMGMKELYALARPSNMSEDAWGKRVHITTDDHIYFTQAGQLWLSCHPKSYRQINLSVARDLAAKHQCNVIVAHGHQWAQGLDRSGTFRILDGGGMFERAALSYQRDTSCHPMTRSGFYVLKDDRLILYEGKA
jgi:predicted phosphodiesterase